MSYYVLAFDPAAVSDAGFPAWWERESEWERDHDYNDPTIASPAVGTFFHELIQTFPAMNGPLADEAALDDPERESFVTDYSIAPEFVYAAFSWAQAQAATDLVAALSAKHGLAVAWVSGDPLQITRPESAGPEKPASRWPWRKK